jgi:hypothetical protein
MPACVAVQDNHAAEPLRQGDDVGVAEVGADLRQVGALEGARMQVDERVAMRDDVGEERMCDARRGAARRVAREIAVQVAPVREIAGAAAEALHVDDRYADDRARQLVRVDVVHHAPHHLDAIQLVAVHRGGQAQAGARQCAVDGEDGGRYRDALEQLGRRPGQAHGGARRNLGAEQLQGLREPVRRHHGLGKRYIVRVVRYGLDEFLDRRSHFAGTRVLVLCPIVTDVDTVVRGIDCHFTRNGPGARSRQQQGGSGQEQGFIVKMRGHDR